MDKVTIHVLKDTFAQTLCNLILYSCKMNFFLSGCTQLRDVKSYSNTLFLDITVWLHMSKFLNDVMKYIYAKEI